MTDSSTERETLGDRDSSGTAHVIDVLETLNPAYFGFIMSTGIISIAFRELGIGAVAWPLALLNVGCYVLLLGLFGVKLVLFPSRMADELSDRERHWGALTFVVGTNTVGTQFVFFFDSIRIATVLWLVTVVVTPILLYFLFATEFIGVRKTAVSERIDGAFLLVIVCMQSLSILGGLLSETLTDYTNSIVLLSMSYFGAGYVLYFVVVTVVTFRLLDGGVRPEDWNGPYWIMMGAAAITTLAGAILGARLESLPVWEPYAPVLLGVTFLAWAVASWWIPLLFVLDIWKFVTEDIHGSPPVWVLLVPWSRLGFGRRLHSYAPTAWGRVFPMGMYTACTLNLAGINTFSLLSVIPAYWGWFALFVWLLTFVGMVRTVMSVLMEGISAGTDTMRSR